MADLLAALDRVLASPTGEAIVDGEVDRAELRRLVAAALGEPAPTWIVEPFGTTGLTQHRIDHGWVRLTVRHGYDDDQVLGSLDNIRGDRVETIRYSWFGGMPGRVAEDVEHAKAAVLGWAREIGAAAGPAPLTVGEALRVDAYIEFHLPDEGWRQVRQDGWSRHWRPTSASGPRWTMWGWPYEVTEEERSLPCRRVPIAIADANPETRGPLLAAPTEKP